MTTAAPAIHRAIELFAPERRARQLDVSGGYLDLLGGADPTGSRPGQRLMVSRTLPLVYERVWRPLGARLLMGALGPDTEGEQRIALETLDLTRSDDVLDLACGPGNFTRVFGDAAPAGLVVGVDASQTMLARAVAETSAPNVAYVRADAGDLPFIDESFDAVCCFAALYLIERPLRAIDEIARVVAPGGRVALLSSCNRGLLPAAATDALVRGLTGVRVFGRDELTAALRERGLTVTEHRVTGFAQFVGARKPAR